ncbi:hypothetical protein [Polaromonas sp. CG_23.6]|uniref:hypothetical protein n=1 Tax=Polaromonas sp. CG_23.6 TaxID=2760709 RepID=UPI002472FE36|nr:hypothetical protein [Polaromonas sp. CG_23.6]MDH6186846.1 hypothetical protein [Polaromonas sp. CG_23.6]
MSFNKFNACIDQNKNFETGKKMGVTSRQGPQHKLAGGELSVAKGLLEAAALLMTPENLKQRKAFEQLMPRIYVLVEKGFSMLQITKLLNECGFKYQPSTVKVYYNQMLSSRMEICQQRMTEQILLMAEIRKETINVGAASEIVSRVQAMLDKQRASVTSKIDSLIGPVARPVSVVSASPSAIAHSKSPFSLVDSPMSAKPEVGNKKTGLHPAPQIQAKPVTIRDNDITPTASGIKLDWQNKVVSQKEEIPSVNLPLRCSVLSADVESFKRRDDVEEYVYLPGDLEHPCLPGVMLSLEQRMSSVALEFVNTENGEVRKETSHEKRFRVLWRKPIPMTISSSSHEFTKMDMSLFRQR